MAENIVDLISAEVAQTGFIDRKVKLPSLRTPSANPESLVEAIKAIKAVLDAREGTSGSILDKNLTMRDLIDSGAVTMNIGGKTLGAASASFNFSGTGGNSTGPITGGWVDPRPYLPVVPVPTALAANGTLKSVFLTWGLTEYINHSRVQVFRSLTDDFGTASLVGASTSNMYVDQSAAVAILYYYWVRAVGLNDIGEPIYGDINAISGTTGGVQLIGKLDLGPLIVEAAHLANGSVTAEKILAGAIDATKFANSIEPITVVTSIPGAKSTSTIFNTIDGKLYRWSGSAYVTSVAAADIAGVIQAINIPSIPAVNITGTLTDAQIAAIAASKLTGTLTDAQIAAIAASKLTGTIVTTQIADNAITTAKLLAGSITSAKIAVDTITAGNIAANAITSSELAAGAVIAGKITAGTIVASDIAASTITSSNIAANTITGDNIAANTITSGSIAANTITSGNIAANTITSSNIAANTITGGNILANSVNADRLVANSITAGKIQAGAIGATEIAAGAITTGKLLVTGVGAALNADPNTQDVSTWTGGSIGVVVDTASPTGMALEITSTGANTFEAARVPIDENRNYLVKIHARQVSGSSTCYLGVEFTNAAGANLNGAAGWVGGTFNYFGLAGSQPPGTYTEYKLAFGPNEVAKIPAGARYFRILMLGNYSGTGVQRFAAIRLGEKASADLIVDGAIVASKLAAESIRVGTAAIQNGAIVNAMMGNASIDTAQIVNLAVKTAQIDGLAVTGAKIALATITDANIGSLNAGKINAGQLSATYINGNNLVIRDGSGNAILGAGTNLAAANITPSAGWLNSNQSWTEVSSRPKFLEVYGVGYLNTTTPRSPGVWVDGVQLTGASWWHFTVLNADMTMYDNWGYGPGGSPDQAATYLMNYVNSGSNRIICVATNDHPGGLHSQALLNALYRCGASRGGVGSPSFLSSYRGSYSLIGRFNSSEGTGIEVVSRETSKFTIASASVKDGFLVGGGQKDIQISAANASTYIAAAAIDLAYINRASIANLSAISANIGFLTSRSPSSGAGSQGYEQDQNGYRVYDTAGVCRVKVGYLV